jgi:hypothetical protein
LGKVWNVFEGSVQGLFEIKLEHLSRHWHWRVDFECGKFLGGFFFTNSFLIGAVNEGVVDNPLKFLRGLNK